MECKLYCFQTETLYLWLKTLDTQIGSHKLEVSNPFDKLIWSTEGVISTKAAATIAIWKGNKYGQIVTDVQIIIDIE